MLQNKAKLFLVGIVTCAAVACGGGARAGDTASLAPLDPMSAVRGFMDAVEAQNITTMAGYWGTRGGLAANRMDREELVRRLRVIMSYLAHDEYEVINPGEALLQSSDQRTLNVRIQRRGCEAEIPFTVVRSNDGWLVQNMDLSVIGNPARGCRESG